MKSLVVFVTVCVVLFSAIPAMAQYHPFPRYGVDWNGPYDVNGVYGQYDPYGRGGQTAQHEEEAVNRASVGIAADEAMEVFTDRGISIMLDSTDTAYTAEFVVYNVLDESWGRRDLEKKVCISVADGQKIIAAKCGTSRDLGRAAKGAAKELFKVKTFKENVKALYLKKD